MIPNIIANLMQGVVYKGQTIGNLGFNADPGWSAGPWGGLLGWDANADIVNQYLDQIIQGGQIPNYDVAIGNGTTVSFPLLGGAQNPNSLVVWSDGSLRLYGVDWYVPTFATNAYVVNGGSGYSVGDQINLLGGSNLVPVRLQVTSVDQGSITGVKILGKGSYTVVTPGPYSTAYPVAYPGFGSNATIGIDWDCSNIQFLLPPSSSASPNIYVLYVGTTFEEAPSNTSDTIYDGYEFVQPYVDDNHPEELFPMLPRDCLTMDTYSVEISGRPLVSSRAYMTDGVTDQYDLVITPQSDQAVMAYLNGTPLKVGLTGDVVINYTTNRLVFITTPAAGQILYVTSIGFGGGGRSVSKAYVVSGGSGYAVGDTITLSANIAYPPNVPPAVLSVTEVGTSNEVVSTDVINAGLYPRLPEQPVAQSATSGNGQNATFNLAWTDDFNLYDYIGDGVTVDYVIPGVNPTINGVMVNVDGIIVPYTWLSNGVRLDSAPAYGANIIIAKFANSNFSTVTETVINITNQSMLTYPIVAPGSTQPVYVSSLVRKNGALMSPPIMQQWTGNGYGIAFVINVDISSALSIQIYIDDVIQSPSTYTIANGVLTFVSPVGDNADIVLLCITSTTQYIISGNSIQFSNGSITNGDTIIVTTYTQDIDYNFRSDEFSANSSESYKLSGDPYDLGTIQVWYNNILQVPQQNYTYEPVPAQNGWSAGGWDLHDWNVDLPPGVIVSIPNQPGWTTSTPITISYMTGLPNAPAIAWRTTTGWDATLSTALGENNQTFLLGNVYTYSTTILVADATTLSPPQVGAPGLVYIKDELISFTEIQIAPTNEYPNRAYLAGIARNRLGTSGSPQTLYNTLYYNGDGNTTVFATEGAEQAISTTVFVNGQIQVQNVDYTFVTDPDGYPAGYYVEFIKSPPSTGVKNVQIVALNQISYDTRVSHQILSNVIDAGSRVQIPGGYSWIPTPNGLQYSNSSLGIFLLEHPAGG